MESTGGLQLIIRWLLKGVVRAGFYLGLQSKESWKHFYAILSRFLFICFYVKFHNYALVWFVT